MSYTLVIFHARVHLWGILLVQTVLLVVYMNIVVFLDIALPVCVWMFFLHVLFLLVSLSIKSPALPSCFFTRLCFLRCPGGLFFLCAF